jgi:hypothetical protein
MKSISLAGAACILSASIVFADAGQAFREGCEAKIREAVWRPSTVEIHSFGEVIVQEATLDEHLGITHPRAAELDAWLMENDPDFPSIRATSIWMFEGLDWHSWSMPVTFSFRTHEGLSSVATAECLMVVSERDDPEEVALNLYPIQIDGLSATRRSVLELKDDF